MGKISPVSIKYTIHASLILTGVADKSDIIGAIFGQTEGLLGADLELRELQKSGRIGRIDVISETKSGKTTGEILLPSSMSKPETAIIAAAMETIERVGPCDAKIHISKIEDVRISKRTFIRDRAKALLRTLVDSLPDSLALTNEVEKELREMEIAEYGKDRLPAGPNLEDEEEVIIVEGRADVLTMLRYNIKNVIALNGATAPETIIELTKRKATILFLDGDRGGDLIMRNLMTLADIDFVTRAPDGKEVEELTGKEIHKALRLKVDWAQAKKEVSHSTGGPVVRAREPETSYKKPERSKPFVAKQRDTAPKELAGIKPIAEELVGTRGACVLDKDLNVLGRVPVKELNDALKNISSGVFAVVLDGRVENDLVKIAEKKGINFIVAPQIISRSKSVNLIKSRDL